MFFAKVVLNILTPVWITPCPQSFRSISEALKGKVSSDIGRVSIDVLIGLSAQDWKKKGSWKPSEDYKYPKYLLTFFGLWDIVHSMNRLCLQKLFQHIFGIFYLLTRPELIFNYFSDLHRLVLLHEFILKSEIFEFKRTMFAKLFGVKAPFSIKTYC